jgi:V8-like Glu-specific endopeptidase
MKQKSSQKAIRDTARGPLLVKEWASSIGIRKAVKSSKAFEIQIGNVLLPKEYRGKAKFRADKKKGTVQIVVKSTQPGKHIFPPDIKSVKLSRAIAKKAEAVYATEGIFPKHLGLSQFPKPLEKKLAVKQMFGLDEKKILRSKKDIPTTIFPPDDRQIFSDTSFPWCTCGKVETAGGSGSGVMIGPRHMMTASHVINWGPNNTAGWVKFTPLKFDTSEPFGVAFATTIYSWNKADGSDGLDTNEEAFDYVVCVLDNTMGNTTGWMGSRGYDTSWNGGDYWGHVGYPADLGGANRPVFIGYQSFFGEDTGSEAGRDAYRIKHKIDVIPGQSGGAYFGWWDNEPWPRVVGIQSGQNSDFNVCGGGNPLSELINYARTQMP